MFTTKSTVHYGKNLFILYEFIHKNKSHGTLSGLHQWVITSFLVKPESNMMTFGAKLISHICNCKNKLTKMLETIGLKFS